MTDTWLGDDFFHQGAFRQTYGLYAVDASLTEDDPKGVVPIAIDRYDLYLKFSDAGLTREGDRRRTPPVVGRLSHSIQRTMPTGRRRRCRRPHEGGGADPLRRRLLGRGGHRRTKALRALEPTIRANGTASSLDPGTTAMVAARWGTRRARRFGSHTADDFRADHPAAWFALLPARQGDGHFPGGVGLRERRRTSGAPSTPGRRRRPAAQALPARARHALVRPAAHAAAAASTRTSSDPRARPVHRPRPRATAARWRQWLVQDQRFVDNRPDVADLGVRAARRGPDDRRRRGRAPLRRRRRAPTPTGW